MRLFQRMDKGGVWYVEFARGKKRSLRTTERVEAERRFKTLQREMAMGKLLRLDKATSKTLGEFIEDFRAWAENGGQKPSTARMNLLALSLLADVAGKSTRLDRVGRKHIDELAAACRRRKLSEHSINTYIRHCKAALSKAVDWEIIPKNPLAAVAVPRLKKKVRPHLAPEQVVPFLASIQDPMLRKIAALYCSTGRRRIELLMLRSELVDLPGKRYCVDVSKRAESTGWYVMTDAAVDAFTSFKPFPKGYLLPRMHPDTMSDKIKQALCDFGAGDVSLQGLRVSFGAYYLSKGGSLTVLQNLLGHANYHTTEEHYKDLVPGLMQAEATRVSFGGLDLAGNGDAPLKLVK